MTLILILFKNIQRQVRDNAQIYGQTNDFMHIHIVILKILLKKKLAMLKLKRDLKLKRKNFSEKWESV